LSVCAGGFEDEPHFEAMSGLAALIICHQPRHCQRILRLVKVDNLTIRVGLEGSERRQEIDRFEHGGFSLRVLSHQHNSPPWKFSIQAGEAAEVGEGEVAEMQVSYQ